MTVNPMVHIVEELSSSSELRRLSNKGWSASAAARGWNDGSEVYRLSRINSCRRDDGVAKEWFIADMKS